MPILVRSEPMQEILIDYEMLPTTWFYVSSLLIIGIFFKFQRFFSIRNLDLAGLLTFSPGLLLVADGHTAAWGYAWVFFIGALFLVRLLVDQILVRRPLLEPNLNASGLTFTGIALVVFLMANVITTKEMPLTEEVMQGSLKIHGQGYSSIFAFANQHVESSTVAPDQGEDSSSGKPSQGARSPRLLPTPTIRAAAVLANLALVLGIVFIGYRHFGNFQTGVAAASLYLLLPYTSQMTGRVDYVVPALLLVWGVAAYRRPITSGLLIGLATGCIFYAFFLLPLWISFYWKRGVVRFLIGLAIALAMLIVYWLATAGQVQNLGGQLVDFIGLRYFEGKNADGFWANPTRLPYRIPIIAGFAAVCGSLTLWPAQKNLGTLISCSALVMLGTQFWHPYQGGLYMGWYLPLLVLTVFRPNLEDRVALTAVPDLWRPRRRIEGRAGSTGTV